MYSYKTIFNIKGSDRKTEYFSGNKAGEIGGAIAISMSAACGIEAVKFGANSAGHSGGAICSLNAPLSIIEKKN